MKKMLRFISYAATSLCVAVPLMTPVATYAASLREVIQTCGADGKKFCQGVGYGKPMQTCLSTNKQKLTPQCQALIKRLDAGEKVRLF